MNIQKTLYREMSPTIINKIQRSHHMMDQLFMADQISHQQYNTYRVYEYIRKLVWRHRSVAFKTSNHCERWGALYGHEIDAFEDQDLERFWIWIERRLKGRFFIHTIDHVVRTGTTQCVHSLKIALLGVRELLEECYPITPKRTAA
jgi:hypothetical protein